MISNVRGSTILKIALIAIVVFAAMGVSAIYAAGGVIYACVNNATGAVRIVNNAKCSPGETPLQWNIVGPQGPAGPQGIAGPQGPAVQVLRAEPA